MILLIKGLLKSLSDPEKWHDYLEKEQGPDTFPTTV